MTMEPAALGARRDGVVAVTSPSIQPALVPSGLGAVEARWVPAAGWHDIESDWREFTSRASANVFLSPVFALAAAAADPVEGLGALVVTRDGAWIGLVAGRRSMMGAVFSIWTHDYAPYGAPLVAPGEEGTVLSALFRHIEAEGVAALDWPLLDDGDLSAVLAAVADGHRTHVQDTHARAVLRQAAPVLSKDHRRLQRRLGEQGELRFVSTAGGAGVDAAIAAFLALEAQGWKGRKGTALAASPVTRGFFEEAVGGLADTGRARIDMLLLDGRPIAAGVVLFMGQRAWYWKTAYDEALSRFSPGLLLSHAVGEAAITMPGVALVDSCAVAGHPMIDRIWPERMTMSGRFIAVAEGAPGWRYHAAWAVRRALAEGKALAKRLLKR